MGLIREAGTPKLALEHFARHTLAMGIMQRFHFDDPRLNSAVEWRIEALEGFDTSVTFCFTPEHEGIRPHHTSPPRASMYFADFRARMIERSAAAQPAQAAA